MVYAIYQPQACDPDGGTLVEIEYPWSGQVPFSCTLENEDFSLPCYGAEAGGGNACVPRGAKLRCVTPRVPDDGEGEAELVVKDAAGNELVRLAMEVALPFHPTSTYTMRKLCPSVWAVGPRGLDDETP